MLPGMRLAAYPQKRDTINAFPELCPYMFETLLVFHNTVVWGEGVLRKTSILHINT